MADSPPQIPTSLQTTEPAKDAVPSETPIRKRIVEQARQENERVVLLRQRQADFLLRSERLLSDVPPCYFTLAQGLRECVARFNTEIVEDALGISLNYEETPGVTLRDVNSDDLRVAVWRKFARFDLGLRLMSRAGKPPVPIIEGYGRYGVDNPRKVLMRIEGWVEGGKTIFWYNLDFRRTQVEIAEVPDRIVMSVLQVDPVILSRGLSQTASLPALTETHRT